jgi:PhnB protein
MRVQGAAGLIEFIKTTFDGQERMRMPMPDGSVAHAEIGIRDSLLMVADANEMNPANCSSIHVYVEDVDGVYQRALRAGATAERAPQDQFYGDRSGTVRDAWGNQWSVASHIEDVSDEEVTRRMEAMAPA